MQMQMMQNSWDKQNAYTDNRDSEDDDYSDSSVEALAGRKKARKNDAIFLTNSATYFGKLPKYRLQQVVENMVPSIDTVATAAACLGCSKKGRSCLS